MKPLKNPRRILYVLNAGWACFCVIASLLWMISPGLVFGWSPLAIVCGCVAYGSLGMVPVLLALDIYAAVRRKIERLDLAALVTLNLVAVGFLVLARIVTYGVVLY